MFFIKRLSQFSRRIILIFTALALLILTTGIWTTSSFIYKPLDLDYVKKSTFRLTMRFAYALSPNDNWRNYWDEFSQETGAILWFEKSPWVIFYIRGFVTAWWFSQIEQEAYALSVEHALQWDNVDKAVYGAKSLKKIGSIVDKRLFLCPSMLPYDETPHCTDIRVDEADHDLDVMVLFARLSRQVPTLKFASYTAAKPGDRVYIIGALLGVHDSVNEGKLLAAQVPYYTESREWRWVVPYDLDSAGGYSGSPVIDRYGHVLGMHRGSIKDPRGSGRSMAMMTPSELLVDFLILKGYRVVYLGDWLK